MKKIDLRDKRQLVNDYIDGNFDIKTIWELADKLVELGERQANEKLKEVTLFVVLDNYYRLRILELLEKRPYYISELQRELGIKVYKSIHDTIKSLFTCNLIRLERKLNTSGRQVEVSLNKQLYDHPLVKGIINQYCSKYNIKEVDKK